MRKLSLLVVFLASFVTDAFQIIAVANMQCPRLSADWASTSRSAPAVASEPAAETCLATPAVFSLYAVMGISGIGIAYESWHGGTLCKVDTKIELGKLEEAQELLDCCAWFNAGTEAYHLLPNALCGTAAAGSIAAVVGPFPPPVMYFMERIGMPIAISLTLQNWAGEKIENDLLHEKLQVRVTALDNHFSRRRKSLVLVEITTKRARFAVDALSILIFWNCTANDKISKFQQALELTDNDKMVWSLWIENIPEAVTSVAAFGSLTDTFTRVLVKAIELYDNDKTAYSIWVEGTPAEAITLAVVSMTAWPRRVAQAPRAGRSRTPWSCSPYWRPCREAQSWGTSYSSTTK